MSIAWVIAGAGAVFVLAIVFGLATGRLDRRAEACCAADPRKDLRMRTAEGDRLQDSTAVERT